MSSKGNSKKMYKKKQRRMNRPWGVRGPITVSALKSTYPERVRVRLGYFTTGALTSSTAGDQVFNANSLFDPDWTSAGHQPIGYDNWQGMYNRYLVHKCHYDVVFTQVSSTSVTVCGVVALNGVQAALSAITASNAIEFTDTKWGILSLSPTCQRFRFRGSLDIASIVGATKERYLDDDRYQALVSASPSEIVGLHLFGFDFTVATNINLAYAVKLEYDAEFYDRIVPTQSLTSDIDKVNKQHSGKEDRKDDIAPKRVLGKSDTYLSWGDQCDKYSVDDFDTNECDAEDFEAFKQFLKDKEKKMIKKTSSTSSSSDSSKTVVKKE